MWSERPRKEEENENTRLLAKDQHRRNRSRARERRQELAQKRARENEEGKDNLGPACDGCLPSVSLRKTKQKIVQTNKGFKMKRKPLITLEQMLASRRKQCGLNQTVIARELGLSNGQFVSNWERNLCPMPVRYFRKVSQLLGIPIREMVDHRMRDERRRLLAKIKAS